jgi:hypothetical protein
MALARSGGGDGGLGFTWIVSVALRRTNFLDLFKASYASHQYLRGVMIYELNRLYFTVPFNKTKKERLRLDLNRSPESN